MLEAAIQNGADAVYFGVPHWNARGRTEDFSIDDVREMIRYARVRGVRTFLAMNVLVFEREMQGLPEFLEQIISLEPDAFIIQDIGLARLIRAIAPNQEIHASTQMTLASAEAVNLVSALGFNRAVLARELSLKQIASIKSATDLELEVFIHGALCVSYSGQCLTSENFGGRSANRGQCAQSCRLPYRIFVDGREYTKTNAQYLFSTRDLCAVDKIDEMCEIGVDSLKVEGRLKSPEYVAAVSKAYRKVLDNTGDLTPADREPLEVLFSRGLGPGWLDGVNHQELVDGTFSNHHGEFLGKVVKMDRGGILVEEILSDALQSQVRTALQSQVRTALQSQVRTAPQSQVRTAPRLGDGILFENPEFSVSIGGRLFGIRSAQGKSGAQGFWLDMGRDFDMRKVALGMKVYRNDSPALEKELHRTFAEREFAKHLPVNMTLYGRVGEALRLTIYDGDGHKVQVESELPLDAARNETSVDRIAELAHKELAALSATAYSLKSLDVQVDTNAFVPGKVLRVLRQNAVAALDDTRCQWKSLAPSANSGRKLLDSVKTEFLSASHTGSPHSAQDSTQISVLVRNPEQIEALRGLDIDNVVMDFDWGVKYDESLAQIRDYGFKAGMATLRIHKPGENHYLKNILRLAPDFALVRSLGALAILRENGISLRGDYSLNAANSLSYDWLLSLGLETLHPSWDLNSTQLFDLLQNIDGHRMEIALHQYMPAFHSEYCAFARALTDGRRFPECGKICTQHKVEILDHKGERHFLQSDAECRNTLFVGKPQSAFKLLPQLRTAGVRSYRIELLDETPDIVRRKVQIYSQAIRGKLPIESAIRQAGVEEKYGLSEGQLFNESTWVDRKKN